VSAPRPITLALAALGGQGGGVVTNWLTHVAAQEGYLAQATSVPGVAQRTGATLYYLEFFPKEALPADGRLPVMALMPSPGDVDVVVATELIEAGRMLERGLVTAERTTLIASTHRAYTISEKSHPADGRADGERLLGAARISARRLVTLDMARLAEAQRAVISAVVLGAIAGARALPFADDAYRAAIRASGTAVEVNLRAFEASLALTRAGGEETAPASPVLTHAPIPAELATLIATSFPAAAKDVLGHGVARLIDYQDEDYARAYLADCARIAALDGGAGGGALTAAVARGLALWMSFEDTMRVAQQKLRPARLAAIRAGAQLKPGQVLEVREFLKPRVEELCGTLPAALGSALLASATARRVLARFTGERTVRTTSVGGYLLLRLVAALRRFRRGTLRYALERARMIAWLTALCEIAPRDPALALVLADAQRLVRGYGDTHARGMACFEQVLAAARRLQGDAAARQLAAIVRAAQADDSGVALARELAASGTGREGAVPTA